MEFMVLYLSFVFTMISLVILVSLAVYLSIKGLGYILSIWLGSHDNEERR